MITVSDPTDYVVFVDESASPRGKRVLLLSACIDTYRGWASFSDDWTRALHASPRIDYFHTREARKRQGQFARWKAIDVDRKIVALTEAILRHDIHVLSCWLSEEDYAETVAATAVPDLHHAYFACFIAILHKVAEYQAFRKITTGVDFVFDEKGDVGLEALFWCSLIRERANPDLRDLLRSTPVMRNDEDVPPLQAADLIAWHKRREKEFGKSDIEIAASMRINELAGAEINMDRAVLELMAGKMTTVPGIQEARALPSIYKQWKAEARKAMRRAATGPKGQKNSELNAFNTAMDAILKADPTKVKAEMEEDKRQREEQRGTKRPKGEAVEAAKERWDGIAKAEQENPKLRVPY
jgi:hypothetical protein